MYEIEVQVLSKTELQPLNPPLTRRDIPAGNRVPDSSYLKEYYIIGRSDITPFKMNREPQILNEELSLLITVPDDASIMTCIKGIRNINKKKAK